ncbi:MAG: hypothetical protein OXP09_02960 [Gammaproteobacteria bacterium]|nr:hypothetical protein [Gammaproteobacteria bacterium]
MFRCEDFSTVPRSRRRAALEFKLPVWSPFERTGHHAVWSGGVAMVWFWDNDKIAPARERFSTLFPKARSGVSARLRTLPETVFYGRQSDGLRLQPCADGFELQRWRANVLADSFWFPAYPQESQLSWFVARQEGDGGTLTIGDIPAPASDQMAREPWSVSLDPQEWFVANGGTLAAACLLALVLAVLWQEVRYWKISEMEEATAREFDRLQEQLTPILEARNELIDLRRTNQALLQILQAPSQAHLMNQMDRAIPNANAELREWRYQQGELAVSIEDRHADPIAYIRALEAVPLFTQVKAEPGPGQDRLEITLTVRE